MSILEKLEVKLAESKAAAYVPVKFDFDDTSGRFHSGHLDPLLAKWEEAMLGDVVSIATSTVQVPESVSSYSAYFTTELPLIRLGGLSVFGLVNQPYDMGAVLETKLIVGKIGSSGDELLDVPPVLNLYSKPAGAFAADSPLFFEQENPTEWQNLVSEVIELVQDGIVSQATR